jgi:type II secretory pathway pseudopilin PulG
MQPDRSRMLRRRRHSGLTIIELVLALSITGMLLTATMVALDASFHAYASAAEEASTQAQTRMITQRLTSLIRTSTAMGPQGTRNSSTVKSDYLELMDANGQEWALEYVAETKELYLIKGELTPANKNRQLILSDVREASFHTYSRENDAGKMIVHRATVDMTVTPPKDASLSIENGANRSIRVIASTMSRRVE